MPLPANLISNTYVMVTPEKLIDLDSINNFFLNLSHGDMVKENALKYEFVHELIYVQHLLKTEMDKKNWLGVQNTIVRVRSVFHILEQKYIADFINDFPDLTSQQLNRVQKDSEVEKLLKLLAYIELALTNKEEQTDTKMNITN